MRSETETLANSSDSIVRAPSEQRTTWHLITPEYPPMGGGVSDYSELVAFGLLGAGDHVHVWCPSVQESKPMQAWIHGQPGGMTRANLRRMSQELDCFPGPRRLLVQWVPHGYGYRSMNVGFCYWLLKRAKAGDVIDLMVHEPFLPFREGNWRQDAAAVVHRLMVMLLLQAATRVWVSVPAWARALRPYTRRRNLSFQWLPVPSNIPVNRCQEQRSSIRQRYAAAGQMVIGHFGTHGALVTDLLAPAIPRLLLEHRKRILLLMGVGGERFRTVLVQRHPGIAGQIFATGALNPAALSCHLSACDLMIQPYRDGVSSRRGTAMAPLAHGLPIVTTSGRVTEEIWRQHRAVSLVPADDANALVHTAETLLADWEERRLLGLRAEAVYTEHFDVRHAVARLRKSEI